MVKNRQTWLQSALGQYLLTYEQALFDDAVADIFGFNAIQVGFSELDLLRNSRIPNLLHADETLNSVAREVICESDALPFEADSIDLVLLSHVLEFSQNPHQTLREVERVLVHEGYVILTGFNPLSAWGFKRLFSRKQRTKTAGMSSKLADADYPWQGQFFSSLRIKDWLALLGLEFVSSTAACYSLPCNHAKWLNRFKLLDAIGPKCWPMLGGVYFIIARKRAAGMTLLKPNWKKLPIKSRFVTSTSQKDTRTNKITTKTIKEKRHDK